MSEFGHLVIVLASCLSATIGVCVYLLKQQQRERERQDARADGRIDKLFLMLDARVGEQTEVIRELNGSIIELGKAMRDLGDRVEHLEKSHNKPARKVNP
jgi:uncharacterized coiled-coil protein SlyX